MGPPTEAMNATDDEERPNEGGDLLDGPHHHVRVDITSNAVEEVNVGTEGLFTAFIAYQLQRDGYPVPQSLAQRQGIERATARELSRIGDQVNDNVTLNNCISQLIVNSDTAYETFASVAFKMFQDGVFNWGRIVMLFVFGYKLAVRVIENKSSLLYVIIKWVSKFVMNKLAWWIASQGGWGAVRRYYGASARQSMGVILLAGVVLMYLYWKK